MRPPDFPQLGQVPEKWDPKFMANALRNLEQYFAEFARMISGSLGFGNGVDFDNIQGKWLTYATNGVANTEDTLVHGLGMIPIGFLVVLPPANGFVYRGATVWTVDNLYLKCSQASQTSLIFVLVQSQGLIV